MLDIGENESPLGINDKLVDVVPFGRLKFPAVLSSGDVHMLQNARITIDDFVSNA